ncbi:MAG: hypothetical protein O2884_08315 [Chloroflexi bacterium]|nr:hypothetical protein [Chloroflexota bacterium]
MSTKAFSLLLLVVVVLGGGIGGVLYAFSGSDTSDTGIAADLPTPTPTADNNGGDLSGESIVDGTVTPSGNLFGDGTRPQGGRIGGNIEPISGTLASISLVGLVITSTDTGADTEVIVPPETPVRLSETAGDTDVLIPGTEIVALLQRAADGTISVTTITIGGFGRGFGGGGGGFSSAGGTGGTTADGSEFNSVPGTITSYTAGALVLESADGSVNITVANDTPIQLTIPFADLTDQLAIDSEITVIGQRDDAGTYTPVTITTGTLGGFGGFGGGAGGRVRGQRGGDGTFTIPTR